MNTIIYKEKIISEIIKEMLGFLDDEGEENAGFGKDDVRECKEILFDYINSLADIEEPCDDEILAEVESAVVSLGELNENTGGALIEAVDKEIILEIIADAAEECGLKTGGEDITEAWREW
jgi:hypothetical protein